MKLQCKSCRGINDRNIIETCDIFPHVMWLKFYMFRFHSHPLTNTAAVSKILFFFFLFCYLHKRRNQVLWQFLQLREHKGRQASNDIYIRKCPGLCGWRVLSVCVCICVRVPEVSVSVSACCFVTKQKLSHKYFPSFWLEIYQRYPPHTHTHRRTQTELLYNYIYTCAISASAHATLLQGKMEIFMKC